MISAQGGPPLGARVVWDDECAARAAGTEVADHTGGEVGRGEGPVHVWRVPLEGERVDPEGIRVELVLAEQAHELS